ncbi:NMCC_0638 family (lipo)protein [Sphingomonas montana]|uniref:NMCC_0638 family (lipo)protein n=1 Tax=Sphingomonas montana TaxID=1843236 RepID=UPI00096D90C4|nr:hypothetical protein [Sphingomonas montana]
MVLLLALIAGASPSEADQRQARMTTLYDQVCLRTFPDDAAVVALMKARNARELTPDEVKVTMRDDPARGWDVHDGGATVWIEFPPFHACSVRWNTPSIGDLSAYRTIAKAYQSRTGGYTPITPMEGDQGDIHIHAVGEQRTLPDKRTESLFIFDQHITDPKRRAAGDTGVSLRFVHQFAPPEEMAK